LRRGRKKGRSGSLPAFFLPPNFLELRHGEILRINLLGTSVNKGARGRHRIGRYGTGRAGERKGAMEAQDLYGTRVRLSRDGLAYGEEFVPLD
jgi:hypothetical protein